MKNRMIRLAPVAMLVLLPASCGGTSTPVAPATGGTSTPTVFGLPQGNDPVELDPATFSTDIDNAVWPMAPGSRWTYRESDGDGNILDATVTVTTETRELANGVTARVVRDTVSSGGAVIEDTFDWYAQDSAGNIWYLGEDTAEFENGVVTSTGGSFEAGVEGALPGIIMPASPVAGMRYREEYFRGEAEDNGEILSVDEMAEVPFQAFSNAILVKDTSTIEPDVLEYKLYAPGFGPVLTVDVSGGRGREELVGFETVSDAVASAAGTTPLGQVYG